MKKYEASIIGLGKLGAAMLACFAKKQIKTIAIDNNIKRLKELEKFEDKNNEKNVSKILKKYNQNYFLSSDIQDAIYKSDLTFIVLPTPSLKDGSYDLKSISKIFLKLSSLIKLKKKYHMFVLCSTVLPLDIDHKIIPFIEKKSGLKFKKNFGFIYSPEFISLGNIINEFLNPQIILIGSENEKDLRLILKIYNKIYNKKNFKILNFKEAELTKIAINSLMTMKISFSNFIGLLSKKIGLMSSKDTLLAVNDFYKNFDKANLAGLGYGGPCLPRDNRALAYLAKSKNIDSSIQKTIDKFNKNLPKYIHNYFLNIYKSKKILFIGIAYKKDTDFYEKSQSIDLIKECSKKNYISLFDFKKIKKNFNKNIKIFTNINDAINNNDIIVLCHNDKRLNQVNFKNKIVIDLWSQLKIKKNKNLFFL